MQSMEESLFRKLHSYWKSLLLPFACPLCFRCWDDFKYGPHGCGLTNHVFVGFRAEGRYPFVDGCFCLLDGT
jgi:hypothetical protein